MSAETINLDGIKVTIRELTVADVRDWLKSIETPSPKVDAVDKLLIEGEDLSDLLRMTNLTSDDINLMTPSGLRRLYASCKEVNADFFGLRARLEELGRAALSVTSSEPSAA